MTIEKTVKDAEACLALTGWLDTQSAPELEEALKALPPEAKSLVLDLAGVEYVSSAGLRQIVAAYKLMNGALTLRHVSDEICNVIRMTGLEKRLTIEP